MRNFKGSTRSREALEMRSTSRRTRPARARDAVRRHPIFKSSLQSSQCVHVDTVQGSILARKLFRNTTVVLPHLYHLPALSYPLISTHFRLWLHKVQTTSARELFSQTHWHHTPAPVHLLQGASLLLATVAGGLLVGDS